MREGERKIGDGNHLYTFTTLRVNLHVAEAISYFDWESSVGKAWPTRLHLMGYTIQLCVSLNCDEIAMKSQSKGPKNALYDNGLFI